jgi:hypothetical protein
MARRNLSLFASSFGIFLNFVLIEFQKQAVGRHLEVQLAVIKPQIDVPFSIGEISERIDLLEIDVSPKMKQ